MAKLSSIVSFILWLLCSHAAWATTMNIDERTPTPLNLTPWLIATQEPINQLQELQSLPKQHWHAFTSDDIGKLGKHDFWLTFSLNSNTKSLSRLLALDNPLLDKVTIYHLIDNTLTDTVNIGDSYAYHQRPLLSSTFIYPFKINAHEQHTFYLHIETEGGADIPLHLWSANDLAPIAESKALEHGLQLGILAAIGLCSLFIALTSGSISYSYYSGYALCSALLVATMNGFAFRFLWPNWPNLQQLMVPILLPLIMTFTLLFTEKILQLKYHDRRMLVLCRYSTLYVVLVGLAVPFIDYGTALYIELISAAVLSVGLMLMAIMLALKGQKLAKLYTIGRGCMLVGAWLSGLLYLNVLALNLRPATPVILGLIFEVIFMSLVLAIRYNDERKAKLRIQQEALRQAQKIRSAREEALRVEAQTNERLERMVQERTLELEITLRELNDANHKLIEQSTIDSLTGVKNRSAFNKRLLAESRISRRQDTPLALLMLDIDRFKSINDRFGHLTGDQALMAIAATLQQQLKRPTDLVSRFGGEEFAIILPNTTSEGAIQVAEGMRHAIETTLFEWEGNIIPLTVSIGISVDIISSEQHSIELLEQADKALYEAKNCGRNQVKLYAPDKLNPVGV